MITNTKKIINTIIDWFAKAFALVVIYLAIFQDVWIAQNFVYFLNFLILLSTLFVIFARDEAKEYFKLQNEKTYFSSVILTLYYWVVILSFVSMGWLGSSFLWFMNYAGVISFRNTKTDEA